jgi:protein TonB
LQTRRVREIPFKRALVLSCVLHGLMPLLLTALVALVLLVATWLFGFRWDQWLAKPTPKDIEFVIVPAQDSPRPKEAKLKGEFNQQPGGETQKNMPPKPVTTPPAADAPEAKSQEAVKPAPKQQAAKPTPKPKPAAPKKPVAQSGIGQKAAPKEAVPAPEEPAESGTPSNGQAGSPGSMGSTGSQSNGGEDWGSGETGSGKGAAVQQADFGPYMAELKRRLTRNWHPPRGDKTQRVVLRFQIARDGRLLSVLVEHSSGMDRLDAAAVEAVKLSEPFKPLPPEFDGESVPILFTFDYTVLGQRSRQSSRTQP